MEEKKKLRLKALVVDDSRIMRSLVMDALRKSNLADFDFTEAGDGAEAMDRFDSEKIDIVFADWNMPQLNGIEFARHVRSMRASVRVPIIMITSEKAEGKQAKAYQEARINAYITKPFTPEEVANKLTPIIEEMSKEPEPAPVVAPVVTQQNKPANTGGFFSKLLGRG